MHPNRLFQSEDRALVETLLEEIGFGMVYASTPDGPRIAHVPLISTGEGAIRFHLSNGNALTQHLAGCNALAVVNGPNAYVSPRWYSARGQVPTWNYISIELEGPVRRLDYDGLEEVLEGIAKREEARIEGGEPYEANHVDPDTWRKLASAITGFELKVDAWRPTFKLSQNKPVEERLRIADALGAQGNLSLASMIREVAG